MTAVAEQIKDEPKGLTRTEEVRSAIAPTPQITPNSAVDLMHIALERGTPIEHLEKLMALHERIADRQAAQEFALAMAGFQAECPSIKKSSEAEIATSSGGKYTYTYAELDEIARTINPILAKFGLSYTWDSTVNSGTLSCVCTVRHIAGHSVSSSFVIPIDNPSKMSPQQKVAGALTFAKRQSLSSVLGLTTTDEDNDAAEADPTPINEDQALVLSEMLAELGTSTQRFLRFMEAKSIEEIRAVDYDRAIAALDEIRVAKEKKAKAAAQGGAS